MPFSPIYFLILLVCLSLLLAFVQIGLLTIAFDKLGLSAEAGALLLLVSLFGSLLNLPLFRIKAMSSPPERLPPPWREIWSQRPPGSPGKIIIAVNLGGCIVPVGISVFLVFRHSLGLGEVLLAITLVSFTSYLFSRPIQGVGIGMPLFVAPLISAITGLLLCPGNAAPLAYVCGTMGVLIGADLLRLPAIRQMGVPVASIGGAGTFDGIFLTGIVAALLA
jgi:uncharacterized membrane protein